jgi:hypothetical protein
MSVADENFEQLRRSANNLERRLWETVKQRDQARADAKGLCKALTEIAEHCETCEDDAELCRRDWVPMAARAAIGSIESL